MPIVLLLSLALAASAPVSALELYQREIVDFALKELASAGNCRQKVVEGSTVNGVDHAVDGTLYMLDLSLEDHAGNAASCPASGPKSISVEVWDVAGSNERRFLGVSHKVEKLLAEHIDVVTFGLAKLADGPKEECQQKFGGNFGEIYSGGTLYGFDLVMHCDGEPEYVCHMKVVVTPQGNRFVLDHLSTCPLN